MNSLQKKRQITNQPHRSKHLMHLRGILKKLAALTLFTAIIIAISAATPLPSAAAHAISAPEPLTPLTKRTNHITLSGLTLRGSRPLAVIVPIEIAALQFANLYTDLYLRAVAELYRNNLGVGSFTLRYNDILEISFVTSEVEAQAVPWEFVRDFAVTMRLMALRGFTGCYDQGYWNEVGDFGVYVGLRLLAPLGLTRLTPRV